MRHLGNRISDLVDERLTDARRERALRHLTTCEPCRRAVERERETRDLLAGLGHRGPQPSTELQLRLLDLAGPEGPLPPPRSSTVGVPAPPAPQPVPWQHADVHDARSRRRLAATGAVLVGTGALVGGLAILGGAADGGNGPAVVVPDPTSITVQHDRSTSQLPFNEPVSVFVPPASSEGQAP